MNALSQGSFENPVTAWALSGSASLVTSPTPPDGMQCLSLFAARLSLGPVTASSAASQDVAVQPGEDYLISLRCNGDEYGAVTLRLTIMDGASSTVFDLNGPIGSGWREWQPGTYTPVGQLIHFTLSTPLPALNHSGRWYVDLASMEAGDMTKRREIRTALVSTVGSVAGVGECVSGVKSLATIETWPSVQIQHGEEIKEQHTLTRKTCTLTFRVGVFAKDESGEIRDDILDDICGAIEAAVEKNDDGAGRNSPYLGLAYVTNVFVESIDPFETEEAVARGISLWVMTVNVTYRHERRVP